MRILRCAVVNRLAHSATGRQPTTAIVGLLLFNGKCIFDVAGHWENFSATQRLFDNGLLTCEFRRQHLRFLSHRNSGSSCLSNGSSFARPEVASSGPDTATPITPSVVFFTARRNARIASAVLATAIPSVCPSVCHTPVLCQNDCT